MQTSSMLANVCLAIATLVFLIYTKEIYLKPMPGGDYGVGYAWAAIFLSLAFIVLTGLSMAAIGWKGGFHWVSANNGRRVGLLLLTFLMVAFSVGAIGMGEGFKIGKVLSRILAIVLPLAVLAAGFLLANDKLEGGSPTPIARWMAIFVFGASGLFTGAFLVSLTIPKIQRTYASFTRDPNQLDSFQEGILVNIDTCDINKDLVFMLGHTDVNRHPIIRERALAKIKSRPDWQEELVRRLDSGWVEEVFTFLASNEVDNKALFPEAVRLGLLQQAKIIRETIKNHRDLHPDRYTWEVDRALRSVEKYEGMGVDYLPAVRELRAAFDQRSEFDQPTFRAAKMIDRWLKKR